MFSYSKYNQKGFTQVTNIYVPIHVLHIFALISCNPLTQIIKFAFGVHKEDCCEASVWYMNKQSLCINADNSWGFDFFFSSDI